MDNDISLSGATHGSVRWLLQAEGLIALAVSVYLYRHAGGSWGLFAVLFLTPDAAMLGYLRNPRIGAACYNAAHTYLVPVLVAAVLILLGIAEIPHALFIWTAHIGFDRMLGYGLKYPSNFGYTHLLAKGRAA